MRYSKIIILLVLFSFCSASAQEGHGLVKWVPLQEALEKVKTQPKPILIDFYTDWCGWCKTMVKTTYSDPGIAQYINTYFYPVQFDAEGKDTIEYLGTKYIPKGAGPRISHPFAEKMLNGQLMYPSTLFLNGYDAAKKEFRLNLTAPGYLDSKKIQPLLIYAVENVNRNCSPNDFTAAFEKAFFDSVNVAKAATQKYLTPAEAFSKTDSTKKTLVLFSSEWCNSCKVMKNAVFTDSLVESKLKKYFRVVEFNPEITDTIQFQGTTFRNNKNPQMPFHDLALSMMKNNFALPTITIMDEKNQLVDAVASFIPAAFMADILEFYGNDIYKTKSWAEFQKTAHVK